MTPLFAYGTLMCEEIMAEVSGCRLTPLPGTLQGYGRRVVRGQCYPALVPQEEGRVNGLVYLEVPPSAWARLDRFEGEMYARQKVSVELSDGTLVSATTYVVQPEFLGHLDRADWDFDRFLRRGKKPFQEEYREELPD